MVPYSLVANLRDRLALLMFSAMAPAAQVGQYAFANRLVNIPLGLAGNAVRPIVFRHGVEAEPRSVERLIMDVLHLLQKCTVPVLVLFLWRASDIFHAAFGAKWGGAYVYAVALVLPAFVLLHTSGLDRLLDIAGRQRLALWMETAFSVISIATVVMALRYWKSMLAVLILQGAVTILYNIVWLLVVFRIAGLRIRQLGALGWALARRAISWSVTLFALEAIGGSLGTQAYAVLAVIYVTSTITTSLYRSGGVLKPTLAPTSS
jgi:O-antigen/teichoic acid export membrane protein